MDADVYTGAVGLLPLNALDVDDELLAVDLHHLAHLLTLVVAADNLNMGNSIIIVIATQCSFFTDREGLGNMQHGSNNEEA